MASELSVLFWPFVACIVLVSIHVYLGIHVIGRKVIFVDIALAQIAALGAATAGALGHEPGSTGAYLFSLAFAVLAAGVFALTRTRREHLPQEAVIGLTYAVASAGAILLADASPHGAEHLKDLLAGSIVWVTKGHVLRTALLYAAIGALHVLFRKRFLLISLDPDEAYRRGMNVRAWDFLFYLLFAVVITTSVQVGGVLLVFCYLIAPAAFAVLFAESLRARLLLGWGLGIVVSLIGLAISYDRPSGPTILCVFGAALVVGGVVQGIRGAQRRGRAFAWTALATVLCAGVVYATPRYLHATDDERASAADPANHAHGAPAHPLGESPKSWLASLGDSHATVRADAVRRLAAGGEKAAIGDLIALLRRETDAGVKEALAKAFRELGAKEAIPALKEVLQEPDEDEWVPLEIARTVADLGDRDGIPRLLELARSADAGLVRKRAIEELLRLSGRQETLIESLTQWWSEAGDGLRFEAATGTYTAH